MGKREKTCQPASFAYAKLGRAGEFKAATVKPIWYLIFAKGRLILLIRLIKLLVKNRVSSVTRVHLTI